MNILRLSATLAAFQGLNGCGRLVSPTVDGADVKHSLHCGKFCQMVPIYGSMKTWPVTCQLVCSPHSSCGPVGESLEVAQPGPTHSPCSQPLEPQVARVQIESFTT